jgi:tRNA threonylcarbamoyladenosine biosynthesis protein TsaE
MSNDITLTSKEAILADEAATLTCGERFSRFLVPGLTVYLHGDLGAGKTTFVRGVLHGLGHVGKVKSPTYTLVEPYGIEFNDIKHDVVSRYNIYHFDLYRFNSEEEWDAAGFRDYFNPQSICMIEWPEKAGQLLPEPDIHVQLSLFEAGRKIQLLAGSSLGNTCLEKF